MNGLKLYIISYFEWTVKCQSTDMLASVCSNDMYWKFERGLSIFVIRRSYDIPGQL